MAAEKVVAEKVAAETAEKEKVKTEEKKAMPIPKIMPKAEKAAATDVEALVVETEAAQEEALPSKGIASLIGAKFRNLLLGTSPFA